MKCELCKVNDNRVGDPWCENCRNAFDRGLQVGIERGKREKASEIKNALYLGGA